MGVFLVQVREDTVPLHAGADVFSGTTVSHNGKRQRTAFVSQPVHSDFSPHRQAAESGQEKTSSQRKERDKTGETPEKTDSRPYLLRRAEQKNFTCVRNFVGYYRFCSAAQTDALAAVYRSLCPLLNFFMPTVKLVSKTRIKKVYDKKVVSPYQRLMASPDLCLEFMDLIVDPVRRELVGAHGDEAVLMAM
jgi:hypothetical protein